MTEWLLVCARVPTLQNFSWYLIVHHVPLAPQTSFLSVPDFTLVDFDAVLWHTL